MRIINLSPIRLYHKPKDIAMKFDPKNWKPLITARTSFESIVESLSAASMPLGIPRYLPVGSNAQSISNVMVLRLLDGPGRVLVYLVQPSFHILYQAVWALLWFEGILMHSWPRSSPTDPRRLPPWRVHCAICPGPCSRAPTIMYCRGFLDSISWMTYGSIPARSSLEYDC